MTDSDKIITLFTTRIRQMILKYKEMKKENEELYAKVNAREEEIKQLELRLAKAQKDYRSLKTARMVEVSDGDIETSKKKIAAMIRQVNKCITLLSGK